MHDASDTWYARSAERRTDAPRAANDVRMRMNTRASESRVLCCVYRIACARPVRVRAVVHPSVRPSAWTPVYVK